MWTSIQINTVKRLNMDRKVLVDKWHGFSADLMVEDENFGPPINPAGLFEAFLSACSTAGEGQFVYLIANLTWQV